MLSLKDRTRRFMLFGYVSSPLLPQLERRLNLIALSFVVLFAPSDWFRMYVPSKKISSSLLLLLLSNPSNRLLLPGFVLQITREQRVFSSRLKKWSPTTTVSFLPHPKSSKPTSQE